MTARLLSHVLAVLALVVASLAAIADQSRSFIGVHEIPPFVHERVEFLPGPSSDLPDQSGGALAP
jgi:hypothetical protein